MLNIARRDLAIFFYSSFLLDFQCRAGYLWLFGKYIFWKFVTFVSPFQFDINGDGHISCAEIGSVLMSLGEDLPGYKIRELIKEIDKDENGQIELNEFLEVTLANMCS